MNCVNLFQIFSSINQVTICLLMQFCLLVRFEKGFKL